MIRVNNLSKNFKVHKKDEGLKASIISLFRRKYITKNAVNNIKLEIREGEILGLIGANGAGKTTLIKMLAGIIPPSSGSIDVIGFNPWERSNKYRSQMSLIMGQKAQLWWDLPAMDGFLLLKEIYQIEDTDFKSRISYLSESLGITNELNVQVRKLSLGERMKVELIAALLHNPKVVYLDEPTIGLDLTAQKAVRKFLKEYQQKFRPIMILTSHYMEDIEELCERVAIMKEGQIVFDGPISEIQEKYAQNKTIKIRTNTKINISEYPIEFGKLEKINDSEYLAIISKNLVMKAASFLLNHYEILDLTIQEDDIGNLIEKIMSDKNEYEGR